jgi:hypothetical protein
MLGVSIGLTVTVNVFRCCTLPCIWCKRIPHREVVLLTTDGLHAPVTPFVDVVGKVGTTPPFTNRK